jgi:penicillin-binding protein 2
VLLADNKPIYNLQVIPEQVAEFDSSIQQLAQLLSIEQDKIDDFYQDVKRQRRFKPVTFLADLDDTHVALFSAQQHKFPGFSIEARLTRYYPYGDSLTHMLGYVAKINKKDLQKLDEAGYSDNYAATYDIGKLGIEKYHETQLHGQVGYQEVEVNNRGRIIRTLSFTPPTPGQDIVLNVDIELQLVAQEAMQNHRGAVVVLDAKSGGVLSLYSNPSYDPNLFVNGISSKEYSKLLDSNDRPLINRSTQGQYPPASTIKPHIAILALEEGIIKPDTRFFDNGVYRLKNVSDRWRDWKPYGHGWVDVTSAIAQSCDTFFYDLAYKLGIDRISGMMYEFGFGEYTGVDLYEESSANMPSRGWKRARHNQPWYIGDTISVGIGQSYWTATPLQLAQSISTIVNRGERFVPQIIQGNYIEGQIHPYEPKTLRPIQLKQPDNWDIALNGMYEVVNNREYGTARNAFKDAHYTSGGKSGTAQLFQVAQDEKYEEENVAKHLRDNAMYVGYAPTENPEIIITIAVENGGGGSSRAAPIARTVMDHYFANRPVLIAETEENESE